MRNLPFHNRIVGILLAQRQQVDVESNQEEGSLEAQLEQLTDFTDPSSHQQLEESLPLREAFYIGVVGLIRLLPAFFIVAGLFIAFIACLSWWWGL